MTCSPVPPILAFGTLASMGALAAFVASSGTPAVPSTEPTTTQPAVATSTQPTNTSHEALVSQLEAAIFSQLSPKHQEMIARGFSRTARAGGVAACFADGTPDETIQAFRNGVPGFGQRFNAGDRWGPTANDPVGGNVGDPILLTFSFVPDGTILPNEYGEGDLPSELFAWLNTVYPGGFNEWKPIFDSIFGRWSELSGLNFVYEPNDDGAAFPGTPGQVGVRGDIRISAKNIDGNNGILAYNYYPSFSGDMVINSFDTFFNTVTNNSLRMRNVLAHELGHGIGFAHVCPVQRNKLMEPFVSTDFDGPRHDDIRAAHFNYGDAFEPNDNSGTATALGAIAATQVTVGTVPAPAVSQASLASIDSSTDEDWYTFTVASTGVLTLDLTSLGYVYDDATQSCAGLSGSCCYGTFDDSGSAVLGMELRNAGGTILNSASNITPGTRSLQTRLTAGTYRARVFATNIPNPAQLYTLGLRHTATPLIMALPNANGGDGAPATVISGTNPSLTVNIANGSANLNASTVRLFYRYANTGSFAQVAMTQNSPGVFTAALPSAPCPGTVNYYFQAGLSGSSSTITLPSNAPTSFFTSDLGGTVTVYSDNFETNTGWTVGPDTATAGNFLRGDPIGTTAQPEDDTTPTGTNCFFTGQSATAGEATGTNDVDGGLTQITSPTINLLGKQGVRVSFQRWYNNVSGATPGTDVFRAQVSINNGSTWVDAQLIGPGTTDDPNLQSGWRSTSYSFASLGLTPTANVRLRFIADDAGAGTVVEAAIDDVVITALDCSGPNCDAIDFNNDTSFFDPQDIDAFLSVYSEGPCIPASATCNDIDFNNDGSVFDPCDIDSFLLVFSEGPCTLCGS
ncbi:MAG: matrixin family metalloprotease [Phycisphaerales bacterium]